MVMHPDDADRMANSADPDQEKSDLGLHCLCRLACPKTLDYTYDSTVSHVMRLWFFSYSVKSFFKLACTAIQWGWMSEFWLDSSSTSILYVCKQ